MRCNAADLKYIPLALRPKTPCFIYPVLPSTPNSASCPWAHESFISYNVIIFPAVFSLLSVMHSNGSRVSKTRVTLDRNRILCSLVVEHRSAEYEDLGLDSLWETLILAQFLQINE